MAPLLHVFIPGLRLVTLSNQRETWQRAWTRSKAHRGQTKFLVEYEMRKAKLSQANLLDAGGLVVLITRLAPLGELDHDDNLNNSGKHVRDGVADALGLDDKTPYIAWRYRQAPGDYGVVIDIYKRACCQACGQFVIGE